MEATENQQIAAFVGVNLIDPTLKVYLSVRHFGPIPFKIMLFCIKFRRGNTFPRRSTTIPDESQLLTGGFPTGDILNVGVVMVKDY